MSTSAKVLRPAEEAKHDDKARGSASCAQRLPHGGVALRYGLAAAGSALFALVYAQFSHGVHSVFMTYMFAILLVGGVIPALVLHLAKAKPIPRFARQAWALALASLCMGSCLCGIFEIAGTGSVYLVVYPVLAAVFAVMAVIGLFRK